MIYDATQLKPGPSRHDHPETAHQGGIAVAHKQQAEQERVFDLLNELGPMTDYEIKQVWLKRWPMNGTHAQNTVSLHNKVTVRRRGLVLAGFVRDSKLRRKNPETHVNNIVWELGCDPNPVITSEEITCPCCGHTWERN